ncbi:unnamed protein product [Agarophyton chilense]
MPFRKRIISALRPSPASATDSTPSPRVSAARAASRKLRFRRAAVKDASPAPTLKRNCSIALQRIADFAAQDKMERSQLSEASVDRSDAAPDRIVTPIVCAGSTPTNHKHRVNDAYVSFVVPPDWCASHISDCFALFCGPCVGYVRAVHANLASAALLDTARLQVISEVSALSSPVFIAQQEISVDYVSAGGFGKGIATFHHGFDAGAVVFAVCGPYEHRKHLLNAIDELRRTARVLAVPVAGMLTSDLITSHNSYHTADTACRMQ